MGIHYRVYNIRSITFRNNRKQMSSWLSSSGQIQPSAGEADQRANLAGDHGRGVCKTVCNLVGSRSFFFRMQSCRAPLILYNHFSPISSSISPRFCSPSFNRGNRSSVWMFFQWTKSLSFQKTRYKRWRGMPTCKEATHCKSMSIYVNMVFSQDWIKTWLERETEDKLWDFWAHNLRQPQTLTAFQERVSSTSFVCYLSRLCFRGTMLKGDV
jgi:hypothetical protein